MKSLFLLLMGGMIMSSFSAEKAVTAPTTSNRLHAVPASDVAGLLINGTLDVSQFVVNNGRLWAICKLKGIVGGIHIDEDCVVPVTVGDCDGGVRLTAPDQQSRLTGAAKFHDCDCITITFECCIVPPVIGPALSLNPEELSCGVPEFPQDALCCVNRLVGTSGSSIHEICFCMNRLL